MYLHTKVRNSKTVNEHLQPVVSCPTAEGLKQGAGNKKGKDIGICFHSKQQPPLLEDTPQGKTGKLRSQGLHPLRVYLDATSRISISCGRAGGGEREKMDLAGQLGNLLGTPLCATFSRAHLIGRTERLPFD